MKTNVNLIWKCIILISCVCKASEIYSTGQYKNLNLTWAVGITNLSFGFDHQCPDNVLTCDVEWSVDNDDIGTVIYSKNDTDNCYSDNLAKLSCSSDGTTYVNSTYHSMNNSHPGRKELSVKLNPLSPYIKSKNYTLQYCPQLESTQPKYLMINVDGKAIFSAIATYNCSVDQAAIVVNNTYEMFFLSYNITCEYTAAWTYVSDIFCSYAPNPLIEIFSSLNTSLDQNEYYDDDNLTLNCTDDLGYPPAINDSITYFLKHHNGSKEEVLSPFSLKPEYNGTSVLCSASNSYTEIIDKTSSGESPPVPIKVRFAPLPTDNTSKDTEEAVQIGKNITLKFAFTANPAVEQNNLNLHITGRLGTNASETIPRENLTISMIETGQICIYEIYNVTEGDYGVYILNVHSPDRHYRNRSLRMSITVSDNSATTMSVLSSTEQPKANDIPLAPIIGGSIAGFLVILLIVVYVLVKIRKKNKGSKNTTIKEERDNPLYGTAAGASSGTEYAMVNKTGKKNTTKEERVNPLYDSNTNPDGVEEAYAAVDIRKKKKKNKANKGNENAAFSTEGNAAVYAAVNKPKKTKNEATPPEAVYSEVNKNKKNKDSTADSTLHGSPE